MSTAQTEKCVRVEVSIDEKDYTPGVHQVLAIIRPDWNTDDVNIQPLSDKGLVNALLLVSAADGGREKGGEADVGGQQLLVRVNDPAESVPWVDRDYEENVFRELMARGLCMPLHARFTNGLVYQYARGVRLTRQQMKEEPIVRLICEKLHRVHALTSLPYQTGASAHRGYHFVFDLMKVFIMDRAVPMLRQNPDIMEQFSAAGLPPLADLLRTNYTWPRALLEDVVGRYPPVFCHQDLHNRNVVWDAHADSVTFIDWEYAGYSALPFEFLLTVMDFDEELDDAVLQLWVDTYSATRPAGPLPPDQRDQLARDVFRVVTAVKCAYILYALMLYPQEPTEQKCSEAMKWYRHGEDLRERLGTFTDGHMVK